MAKKGSFVFRGDKGKPNSHTCKTVIDGVTDDAALATLQVVLQAHTATVLQQRTFSEITSVSSSVPGLDVNVDLKAIFYFKHPTTFKVHSITLPAPPSADIELTDNGQRLKASTVTAVVAAIAVATTVSYIPLYGVIVQVR